MRVADIPTSQKMVSLSESGAFIFSLLSEDTTPSCSTPSAPATTPRAKSSPDLSDILAQLREADLLEE